MINNLLREYLFIELLIETSSYFYPFAFYLYKLFCKFCNVEITLDNIEQNVSIYKFKYYIQLKGCID
jgi:hypothetical protein